MKYAILDRDGTVIEDVGYPDDPNKVRFFSGAVAKLRTLREHDYKLLIITNQSGIGRGYYSVETYDRVNSKFLEGLRDGGVEVEAVLYCPHRPDDGCDCRKPHTRLVDRHLEGLEIDLDNSYVVGDKTSDIKLGENLGCRTILVKTGKAGEDGVYQVRPTFVAQDICEAVDFIISQSG